MLASLLAFCALAPALPPVETAFVQVAPAYHEAAACVRSPGQARAVVLLHGLLPHPFSRESVARPLFHEWQKPGSLLVKRLGQGSDVFAFAYGQNVPADEVAESLALREDVRRLQALGYQEIVLLGHSAGGVIAREFVEDNPDSAVTKVVQVCAPNGGCFSATLKVPHSQEAFVRCLTARGREQCLKERAGVTLPESVQFVCFVGQGLGNVGSDGVVSCRCQWTADLQKQGVPAVAMTVGHREAVRSPKCAHALAELVRKEQPRWRPERVQKARKEILGK